MSKMAISIIIPTFKRIEPLKKCIESILNQAYPMDTIEVIIVDDAQSETVLNLIKTFTYPNVIYLKGKGCGPASARNSGAAGANGEILAFIDDDCAADNHWLESIAVLFRTYPDISACGGKIANIITQGPFRGIDYRVKGLDGMQESSAYLLEFKFMPLQLIDTVNLAIRKDVFTAAGGFNEKFAWAGESPDFIYNLLKNKYKIYFNPNMRVYHYARHKLKDIASGMYKYGVFDAVNFKTYFKNCLVLDIPILKPLGMKRFIYFPRSFTTCCVRIDLLKIVIFFILIGMFNHAAGLLAFFLFFLLSFMKFKKVSLLLKFFFYSVFRDFWYLLGHLIGSFKNGVLYL